MCGTDLSAPNKTTRKRFLPLFEALNGHCLIHFLYLKNFTVIQLYVAGFKQNDAYHFYQDLSRIEVKIQSADSQNCFLPITDERERSRSPELLYPPIANIAEVSKRNYQERKNLV